MDASTNRRHNQEHVIFTQVYLSRISCFDQPHLIIVHFSRYNYRCMTGEETPQAVVHNDIAIQISLGTYKLFYEAGTEDVLCRQEDVRLNERAKARHEDRKRSVWLL